MLRFLCPQIDGNDALGGSGWLYSQMISPVAASTAWITSLGLPIYITPSWTIGVISFVPAVIARAHTSCRLLALVLSICSSGL